MAPLLTTTLALPKEAPRPCTRCSYYALPLYAMPSTRLARPASGVVVVIVVEIVVVIAVAIVVVGEDLQNCGLLSKDRHRDN